MDVRHKRVYTPLRFSRLARPPHRCPALCWAGYSRDRVRHVRSAVSRHRRLKRDKVLRRQGDEIDAALGTRWGRGDLCSAAGCLRDYRTTAAGSTSATARAPGPPAYMVSMVRTSARTLAQRRAPRDLPEFLWPVCPLPAFRGMGHRVD